MECIKGLKNPCTALLPSKYFRGYYRDIGIL